MKAEGIWKKALVPAVAGGTGFWAANFAISRTRIAAEYRAALSIPYLPMLLESLLGGLVIGFCVSYSLHRLFDKIPGRSPMSKSLVLSSIALITVTVVLEAPARLLGNTSDALRYFVVGAVFNLLRILALGTVIGYLCQRTSGSARA